MVFNFLESMSLLAEASLLWNFRKHQKWQLHMSILALDLELDMELDLRSVHYICSHPFHQAKNQISCKWRDMQTASHWATSGPCFCSQAQDTYVPLLSWLFLLWKQLRHFCAWPAITQIYQTRIMIIQQTAQFRSISIAPCSLPLEAGSPSLYHIPEQQHYRRDSTFS